MLVFLWVGRESVGMSLYVYSGSLVFSPKKGGRCQVCLDDILFFEHHGKKVIIHTVNKQYEIRNISLTRVQEIVGNYGFTQRMPFKPKRYIN